MRGGATSKQSLSDVLLHFHQCLLYRWHYFHWRSNHANDTRESGCEVPGTRGRLAFLNCHNSPEERFIVMTGWFDNRKEGGNIHLPDLTDFHAITRLWKYRPRTNELPSLYTFYNVKCSLPWNKLILKHLKQWKNQKSLTILLYPWFQFFFGKCPVHFMTTCCTSKFVLPLSMK